MPRIFATRNPEITQRELDHAALSRHLAGECVVLLENDGALPLGRPGTVALYGSGARQTVRGGTGSGDVNTRSDVNIEQGLERAGFTVATKCWLDRQDAHHAQAHRAYLDWVRAHARENRMQEFLVTFFHPFSVVAPVDIDPQDIAGDADTAVYVIARNSGEGADRYNRRGDYLLYDQELAQLKQLTAAYARVIVVLNVGGVIDLSEMKAIPGISAILLLGQLGSAGGDVLADVLLGKANPSGKLADSWAARYEDYPSSATFSHNNGNLNDEYYTEGIYVGYRYFDTFGVTPLYPFGHGLSYTDFSVRTAQVRVEGEQIHLSVAVTNRGGKHAGKEVVQVYCCPPAGKLHKPHQALIAFAKTELLAPGQTQTLDIAFPARDMASYCETCASWVLEAGEYALLVGNSSRNTQPAAVLEVSETVKTRVLKNLFADADPVREITPPAHAPVSASASVPRIVLNPQAIRTEHIAYQGERTPYSTDKTQVLTVADVRAGRCTVEELVAQLTIEEMAELCVGTLRAGGSVVDNASYTVPGAAGDTSPVMLSSRGVKNMILADGPAGLRLQPVFKTDKAGHLLPGGSVMGDIVKPFDPKYTDENSDTYYQYCTAIPIGWSLAQSWNMQALRQLGSMVGAEMEEFGVDLWLAPALNLHRNPLCGRNFEYYSEDPLLGGKAAAAITLGVQSHPGKGTTIKHFAANNQEDNRYFTNAHISERALRELYLKGFEIAVRESQPLSIMTSYNLLTGTHTANHRDLIQSALRDEWGFEGFVMTDWFTSQHQPELTRNIEVIYPISASAGCVFAGNDVQMPGCQQNVDDIVRAVKTGEAIDGYRLTLADLQFCAANVIRVAMRTDA